MKQIALTRGLVALVDDRLDGRKIYLGLFADELEAAHAYNEAGLARDAHHFTPNELAAQAQPLALEGDGS